MIRTLIRTSLVMGALALVPLHAGAKEPTNAEQEGNRLERKGTAEEKAADVDKAHAAKLEKKGKALKAEGKDKDDKSEEAAGEHLEKKGKTKMKAAEARGDAAEGMQKAGNKVEKDGVKEKKAEEKARRSVAARRRVDPRSRGSTRWHPSVPLGIPSDPRAGRKSCKH